MIRMTISNLCSVFFLFFLTFCISALGLIYNRNYIVQNYKVSRGSNFHTTKNAPWSRGLFKYVVIIPPKGISLIGNVNMEYLNKLVWKPHMFENTSRQDKL